MLKVIRSLGTVIYNNVFTEILISTRFQCELYHMSYPSDGFGHGVQVESESPHTDQC